MYVSRVFSANGGRKNCEGFRDTDSRELNAPDNEAPEVVITVHLYCKPSVDLDPSQLLTKAIEVNTSGAAVVVVITCCPRMDTVGTLTLSETIDTVPLPLNPRKLVRVTEIEYAKPFAISCCGTGVGGLGAY